MISPRRSLADVNPKNALLWAEFRTKYLLNGLQVTDNLGRYPGAPKTLLMGDGTTANTIPAKITGKRGLSFIGSTNYVNTGIIDPFERTDKFSLFVFSSCSTTNTTYTIGNLDNNQSLKGFGLFNIISTGKSYLRIDNMNPPNCIIVSTQAKIGFERSKNTICATYNGSSLASGCNQYINGANATIIADTNNLTATIKNGKSVLIGGIWTGTNHTYIYDMEVYFAAIFPWDLTPQQVQYLDRLVKTRINQP